MKKKVGLVLRTLLLCILMLEAGLRVIGRNPTNLSEGIGEQYGDSFRLRKNITKIVKFPAFSYTIHTNEFGFRDEATGPRNLAGKRFCVFLGASDVFGNGVNYEESFVGVFAREARKGGLEVLNLAVGGHYFLDQESLLKDFIRDTRLTPAIVFHCVNALHIPKFDRKNQHVIIKNGHIIDKDGWRIAYVRLMAGNMSSAFCFFRDGIRKFQERYMNYEVSEKSPEFFQVYDKRNPIRQQERLGQFYEHLGRFESFCRENGIEVAYLYMPLSDSFRLNEMALQIGLDTAAYDAGFYEELIRSHCETAGFRLMNPRPILECYYKEGKVLRFKLDPHFNEFANKVIGDYLIEEFFRKKPT